MGKTRLAILFFTAVVVLGPLYSASGYSPISNVISELAAQNTPRNYVMAAGFVLLGAAMVADGIAVFRRPLLPFMAFGVCFGAAGLFGHKPITSSAAYVPWIDSAHSALATLSGICLTIAFAWQATKPASRGYRSVALFIAALCLVLPLLMLRLPQYQGVIQRLMYLIVFAWLWACYPARARA